MILLYAGLYYIQAYYLKDLFDFVSIHSTTWSQLTGKSLALEELILPAKTVATYAEPYALHLYQLAKQDLCQSLLYGVGSFILVIFFFLIRGMRGKRQQHLAGRKQISPFWLTLKLKLTRQASHIKIGSLPLVKNNETQHILVTGGTGSGKTNCFHYLLPQVRQAGQKAIIIDTTGVFVDRYYRADKDYILNPFDERGQAWHPWVECRDHFDYDALAASLIPLSSSEQDNYWRVAASTVFSSLLQKCEESKSNQALVQWLLFEPLPKLCDFVKGTKAASHLDMSSERTASSIRSVASSYLSCLEYLKDTQNPFSIRDWMQKEEDSWLFLNCKPTQRSTLNPLLSCWFSTAVRSLMYLPPDLDRRIWFVIDELPSLNRLRDLEVFLAEGRKYGGCGLIALQSPSQLNTIYGGELTKTLIGNCMTKIVFAEQDPQIAELLSRYFGKREFKEYQEGLSYGAHEMRDGVNLSLQSKQEPLISASAIQSLKKNQAYVKLPGNLPITKLKLAYKK